MPVPKRIQMVGVMLIASMVAGCGTATKQSSTSPHHESNQLSAESQPPEWLPSKLPPPGWRPNPNADYVGYEEQPPIWLYVPLVHTFDQPAGGYPSEVARRSPNYTTNRIEVTVAGCVQLPGLVRLPEGGTVLQAISLAGGFNVMAFTRRIQITKRDNKQYVVYLHFRRSPVSGHRIAWYGNKDWNSDETVMDYILEDGDKVAVPMTQ